MGHFFKFSFFPLPFVNIYTAIPRGAEGSLLVLVITCLLFYHLPLGAMHVETCCHVGLALKYRKLQCKATCFINERFTLEVKGNVYFK